MKNVSKIADSIMAKSFNDYNRHFEATDEFIVVDGLSKGAKSGIKIKIIRSRSVPPLTSSDPTKIGEGLRDDIVKLIDIIKNKIPSAEAVVDKYVLLSAEKGELKFYTSVSIVVNKKDVSNLEEAFK